MTETTVSLTAGKVPGAVKQFSINAPATVLMAMQAASKACGFSFSTEPYSSNGRDMVDVPFLNGKELATRDGDVITEVLWKTPVSNGDVILLVPKIKGNQFIVNIARVPGETKMVALLEANEPEAEDTDGTVAGAITAAKMKPFNPEKENITVNGKEAGLDTVLTNNDVVLIQLKDGVEADAEDEGVWELHVPAGKTKLVIHIG